MISHEHRFIFIHIPKCAGTSIEQVFGHLDSHRGRGGQDHRSLRMLQPSFSNLHRLHERGNLFEVGRRFKHHLSPNVSNPNNKIQVSPRQYQDYFKFTIVRNPWARAYSWYRNYIRDPLHKGAAGQSDISFHEFLHQHAGRGMLRSQLYWITDYTGRVDMDYIGRFENLNADFGTICNKIGIETPDLPHKTKGDGADYRDAYDQANRDLISTIYQEEIKLFDYAFD